MKQRKAPLHIPVEIEGITYNDVRSAWRAVSPEGLPEITVRKRLDMGWSHDDAFLMPPIEPQLRRFGHG